jgi:hypothetical protein
MRQQSGARLATQSVEIGLRRSLRARDYCEERAGEYEAVAIAHDQGQGRQRPEATFASSHQLCSGYFTARTVASATQ